MRHFIKCLRPIYLSLQSLLSVGGISVMYKVQLLGPQNVLHKYEPFLLNPPICMLLYLGSTDEFLHFANFAVESTKRCLKGCVNSTP